MKAADCQVMTVLAGVRPARLLAADWPGASPSGRAQQLDLSHGGPIAITASDGIEWRQEQREVIARGNATAVGRTSR